MENSLPGTKKRRKYVSFQRTTLCVGLFSAYIWIVRKYEIERSYLKAVLDTSTAIQLYKLSPKG